jgi:glycosyltransferase involved in cell wall biosynthesis
MIELPLVSIALATFNGDEYLKLQLQSLLEQDYPNLEIVIADDGSTDATWQILEQYASSDVRIRLLPRQDNLGVIQNFSRCFAACRGDLISPCDQDDVWHRDKTRRLVETMGDALLIYCNSRLINPEGNPVGGTLADSLNMLHGSDPRHFIFSNSVLGHAMLFRKSLLKGHGAIAKVPHDWWLAFVASDLGYITYLDEVLVDYRRHDASITYAAANNNSATHRGKLMVEDAMRLDAMAQFPGRYQACVQRMFKTWMAWRESYLDLSMFFTVLREGKTTHRAFLKERSTLQLALKYLAGHQLKRLLNPKHYPK